MGKRLVQIAEKPGAFHIDPPSPAVVDGFKSMWAGTGADAHQQRMVLEWLIYKAGAKDHFPAQDTDRDTMFSLGRLFVADAALGLLKTPVQRSG